MSVAGLSVVALAATLAAGGTALVGLFIAYHAYRGLRRNESRPMWFLSVGLVLVFGVTYGIAFVGQGLITARVLPIVYRDAFRLGVRLLQLTGLLSIAYSMHLAANAPDEELRKD
jgi:hypothetical protein